MDGQETTTTNDGSGFDGIANIPTGAGGFNFYAPNDGVNRLLKGGLDEFGIWEAQLNSVDDATLNNGGQRG